MKTRCIIVDDEPLAIEAIQMHIEKFESLKLVATCIDAFQAFDILNKTRVDLMFLDIQMPEITGLDFLKSLKNPPKVILTTAYREYALDAFDLNVIDYLLKPISFDRFMQAINKFYEQSNSELFIPGISMHNNGTQADHIYVRSDKKNVKIKFADILYIESIKDYVKVVCQGRTVIAKMLISEMESMLPAELFLRIHRSYIICIENIEAFSNTHIDVPGKELPIGRNYKHEVIQTLQHK
ncbi:MAG: response regulator transcription factor [Cyclobacteriaceae bacterium]|jgi:DNA-binding LytR/AlgR family response regulator